MDTRVKIAASVGIVLAGILLAMLFPQSPRTEATGPSPDDSLVLRKHTNPATTTGTQAGGGIGKAAPSSLDGASQPPTILKPMDRNTSPPDRANTTAPMPPQGASRWGVSAGQVLPDPALAPLPLKHKIVDGDTLAALAERYLGSAERAMEIFEANRSELTHPQILPIGVELRIPPRDGPMASAPGSVPDRATGPAGK